jgi:hypothetical protein
MEEVTRPALDLHDLSYLAAGTPRQRQAYAAIERLGIMADLARYTPALAGTIPLDLEVEGSDLDVICGAADLTEFSDRVRSLYGHHEAFAIGRQPVRGVDSAVPGFWYAGWNFELFAQDVPVAEQYACLHLLVEDRLLRLAGETARGAIRELKRRGLKTEPAFARYFGLAGDPYEALARLARASEEELRAVAASGAA